MSGEVAAVEFVELRGPGRALRLEVEWVGPEDGAPAAVFLHEGLGSRSTWRGWPAEVCAAGRLRGLVYSRAGYGRSTPRAPGERWPVRFMHDEALSVLPRVLAAMGLAERRPWLVGHSDGASIALILAATRPEMVAGVVAVAPHVMVEAVSIASITAARAAYVEGDLRPRLARHHDDPDSAFWGWNEVWLDPAFRAWSIEALLPGLRCPVLAVQGTEDAYGTLAQIEAIRRAAPQTELLVLPGCGHSPHRERRAELTRAVVEFVGRAG